MSAQDRAALVKDGVALLRRMLGPCDVAGNDHDWHDCRRCRAYFDLESRHGYAVRLVTAVVGAVSLPRAPSCVSDVCLASKHDGVLCADDECDYRSGVRTPPEHEAVRVLEEVLGTLDRHFSCASDADDYRRVWWLLRDDINVRLATLRAEAKP